MIFMILVKFLQIENKMKTYDIGLLNAERERNRERETSAVSLWMFLAENFCGGRTFMRKRCLPTMAGVGPVGMAS